MAAVDAPTMAVELAETRVGRGQHRTNCRSVRVSAPARSNAVAHDCPVTAPERTGRITVVHSWFHPKPISVDLRAPEAAPRCGYRPEVTAFGRISKPKAGRRAQYKRAFGRAIAQAFPYTQNPSAIAQKRESRFVEQADTRWVPVVPFVVPC